MTTSNHNVDYEQRAQRMIKRWAGIQGKVRTDQERKVTEIFTDRYENGSEPDEYILGFKSLQKIHYPSNIFNMYCFAFRNPQKITITGKM